MELSPTGVVTWLLLAGLIVLVAGGAVFIGVVLRKAFPGLRSGDHNDALRFGYGVIAAAWPVAARGGSSAQADQALQQRLYRSVQDVAPRTDIHKTFLTTAVGNLEKISQGRTERLIQADVNAGPGWPLWAVIVLTSGMVLGSAIAFGVENPRMHYVVD